MTMACDATKFPDTKFLTTIPVEGPAQLVRAELLNKTASFASNVLRQVGFGEDTAFGNRSAGFVPVNYRFARFGWFRYSVFSLI